jgi:hypothetical protein
MGVAVAHGKKPAASKHGFSFGGKVLASVAALSMLARDYSAIPNKNASTDCHPSTFWTNPPKADFPVPPSVREIDTNPLAFNCLCSPFGSDGGFDIDDIDEVRKLLDDPPDEDQLQEIGNMIHLTTDTLFNTITSSDQDEKFQNGFGVNMVSHGRYFYPVVHSARRNEVLLASNVWVGPTPAFHGLPYSYTHWRRRKWHHFAELFISTSIVAHELWYKSPMQYVEAQGWTLSNKHKLHYRQIDKIIYQNAPGRCAELHKGFMGMVSRLYNMIKKDGLKDPYTGKPAINFLDRNSFVHQPEAPQPCSGIPDGGYYCERIFH